MKSFAEFDNQMTTLLSQPTPPLVELRKAILDIEELLGSDDYQAFTPEERVRTQNLRKELKSRLRLQEEAAEPSLTPGGSNAFAQMELAPQVEQRTKRPAEPLRNSAAEEQMEEAEKLFYSGRYSEAIRLFDRVIQMEPNWERARQHRLESENYLRTGYIPQVALPAEAASAFGKAQSAARVGRFADALTLLSRAQAAMRELGIQRWQEGLEFEQKLQENIDAENTYFDGMRLFEQGKIDDAIDRVETAARATGLPKYSDKTQELRKFKETLRKINEALSALNLDAQAVSQAKADLDLLVAQYGDNPALEKVLSRFESAVPRAVAPLKDQARSMKAQAERADTIEETLRLSRQVKMQLDQIRNLGGLDETLDYLQNDVDKLIRETLKFEQDIALAMTAYETHRSWPAQAYSISEPVRQRYPNDPKILQLNRLLSGYRAKRNLVRLGIGLTGLLFAGLLVWFLIGRAQAFIISLTPTPTPTATATSTLTPTPTQTATSTPPATATASPSATPTPLSGAALRDLWARSGCYESYNASGRIPAGGQVNFLPGERRFDTFNRECILIEYRGADRTVIGWVLLVDIGAAPEQPPAESTATPQ